MTNNIIYGWHDNISCRWFSGGSGGTKMFHWGPCRRYNLTTPAKLWHFVRFRWLRHARCRPCGWAWLLRYFGLCASVYGWGTMWPRKMSTFEYGCHSVTCCPGRYHPRFVSTKHRGPNMLLVHTPHDNVTDMAYIKIWGKDLQLIGTVVSIDCPTRSVINWRKFVKSLRPWLAAQTTLCARRWLILLHNDTSVLMERCWVAYGHNSSKCFTPSGKPRHRPQNPSLANDLQYLLEMACSIAIFDYGRWCNNPCLDER